MNLFSQKRADYFSKYEWLCDPLLAEWIVNHLEKYGGSILDVGCGNGFMFDYYQSHFNDIYAIDPSETLSEAISNNIASRNITFKTAAAESIPFPDDFVDVTLAKSSLHHFFNPTKGLEEMARISKRVVSIMEVVAPSEQCLPFLQRLLVKKESGRAKESVYTSEMLYKLIKDSINSTVVNQLYFDQYIDVETWLKYSDLSKKEQSELLDYILSIDSLTRQNMQFHTRNNHYVMLRRMCLCMAFT